MLNEQAVLDVRQLITGKDGMLYVTTKAGNNIFLAEVDTFSVKLDLKNTDYQPVGSYLVFAVPTGYSVTLTLTEAVVRDNIMLGELMADLMQGYTPWFDFQGKNRRRDGNAERIVLRQCISDGSIDLMNLNPGEIIKRSWSFRCNATPELLEAFPDHTSSVRSDIYG